MTFLFATCAVLATVALLGIATVYVMWLRTESARRADAHARHEQVLAALGAVPAQAGAQVSKVLAERQRAVELAAQQLAVAEATATAQAKARGRRTTALDLLPSTPHAPGRRTAVVGGVTVSLPAGPADALADGAVRAAALVDGVRYASERAGARAGRRQPREGRAPLSSSGRRVRGVVLAETRSPTVVPGASAGSPSAVPGPSAVTGPSAGLPSAGLPSAGSGARR